MTGRPAPNRLAQEANHRAEGYLLMAAFGALATTALAVILLTDPHQDPDMWQRAVIGWPLAGLSYLMRRRWRARAVWLASAERWWERLDEAPPVRPFPRVTEVTGRWMRWFSR